MRTDTLTGHEYFDMRHKFDDADSYSFDNEDNVIAHYDDGRFVHFVFHDDKSVTVTQGNRNLENFPFDRDIPKSTDKTNDLDLGFGYSSHVDWEALELTDLEFSFVSALPHGSGIDYDWYAERQSNGKLRLSNAYHFMNDGGYYIGSLDFTVIADPVDLENFRLEFNGLNSTGYAWVNRLSLRDYLESDIALSVDRAKCEHKSIIKNDHDVRICQICGTII